LPPQTKNGPEAHLVAVAVPTLQFLRLKSEALLIYRALKYNQFFRSVQFVAAPPSRTGDEFLFNKFNKLKIALTT
jgi:hypothetical protein